MAALTASFTTLSVSSKAGSFQKGQSLRMVAPKATPARQTMQVVAEERIRLNNLTPLPGSRRKEMRKGRGYGGKGGGTCGVGNRGQKSRTTIRPGFEGGQNPIYRALPKLRGICGGMSAGKLKFVTVNLKDLAGLEADSEVSLESLKAMGMFKADGAQRKLPLKVLGEGELSSPLKIKAASFSASAVEKIKAAGGSVEIVAQKEKWTRAAHEAKIASA
mmetsp:Transcript_18532/g.40559  ORF Transcript_18532/g.40559 Transcript_18532/m.40559 type:complete len:218 (-) Transcript_18532:138-791(-)|eukprot:CAMPEP_0118935322 /NCGR_PEP_ID=MMETSP1169-20130426/15420_1 /TAXON_ID=36882 /ORGANISM="Pyramimonas obovata, Strain CCMP722" /LENGTH=217 /DNA_ID=CAMNT_0006878341 /DNA_START=79 /DNA_END=732 /DNA_ORIENTATION=-